MSNGTFNQGAAITTGGIAGALGDALSGFVQGRQIRQQQEEQKQLILEQKAKLADATSSRFRAQLQAMPQLADNPAYFRILQNASKQYGFDLPMKPDGGGLDVQAFAPKSNLMDQLDTPEKLAAFQTLSPEGQKTYASRFDLTGVAPGFVGTTVRPVTSGEVVQAMKGVADQLKALPQGKATIGSLDAMTAAFKQFLPEADTDAILNADPAVLGKLGADARGHLNWLSDHGIAVKGNARAALENATTLQSFRQANAEHFRDMDAVQLGRLNEEIRRDDQHHAEALQRADIARERISATLQGKGGVNAVTIARGDITTIKGVISSLQQSQRTWRAEAQKATDNDDAVPQPLQDKIDNTEAQIEHWQAIVQDAEANLPNIENNAIRNAGGGTPIQTRSSGNIEGQSAVTYFTDRAKSLAKPQRMQALTSSAKFKALSASDKAAVARAIQALP